MLGSGEEITDVPHLFDDRAAARHHRTAEHTAPDPPVVDPSLGCPLRPTAGPPGTGPRTAPAAAPAACGAAPALSTASGDTPCPRTHPHLDAPHHQASVKV